MNETSITIQIPDAQQLPASLLSNIEAGFKSAFEQAEKWRQQALSITVTSLDQKAEMKLARTIRLELKGIRIAAEKERVKLKANALLMGKAIDGVNSLLLAAIVPLEKHLEEQEQYGERLAEAERQRIKAERECALTPYIAIGQHIPALDGMTADQFSAYLEDAKLLHAAKIEAARKAEADRIAKEQEEAAERERLRLENEKLRAEAIAAEAKAKTEREAAEKARREAAEIARKEREAIEAKALAERRAAEREAAERERLRLAELAEIAATHARVERNAKALRDAEEKRLRDEAEAIEAARKAEKAALAKAARAPDKIKLREFAQQVRALIVPSVKTEAGKEVASVIAGKVASFATWIENQTQDL